MKRILLLVTAIFVTGFNSVAQTSKPDTSATVPSSTKLDISQLGEVRRAIDRGNAQWIEAWEKGDPSLTTAVFAPDGKFLQSNGNVIKGREQILEWQAAFMKGMGKGAKVGITTLNVWLDGSDTAYEVGKYRYDYLDEGKASVLEGKYVVIWKKQSDGSWKVFMDMGVPNN